MTTVTLKIQVDKAGASEGIRQVKGDLDGMGAAGAAGGQQAAGGINTMRSAIDGAKAAVGAFLAVYAGIQALSGVVRLADEYQGLTDRLRLATDGSAAFEAAQAGIFAIAQQTGSALGAVTDLYVGLARSTEQLGLSQNDLLTITTAINQSFAVSGTNAASAEAATRQLGQAFASGVLRGDEFNSMMENAPGLASALATSLGVTTGELRRMAEAGELTSEVLATGLLDQAPRIAEQFGEMGLTVGRAFQQLSNSVLRFVGEASQASGAGSALAAVISGIATVLPAVINGFTALAAGYVAVRAAAIVANPAIGFTGTLLAGLATALGVVVAAYLAFKIGEYLANEFEIVRAAGAYLVIGLNAVWEGIKNGASLAMASVVVVFTTAIDSIQERLADLLELWIEFGQTEVFGQAIDFTYGQADALAVLSGRLRESTDSAATTDQAIESLRGKFEESTAASQELSDGLFDGITAYFGTKGAADAAAGATGRAGAAAALSADQIKELEAAQDAAAQASNALRDELERQAALSGGPVVAAYIELAKKLREVDALEIKLAADQGLSRAEAELLRTARVGLTTALVAEVTALSAALTPYEQYLAKLEDERRLLGLIASGNAAAVAQYNAVKRVMEFANAERERGNILTLDEIANLISLETKLDATAAATDRAKQAAEAWSSYWDGAIDAVSGAFGDFVASGLKSFSDFGDALMDIARKIISDLVAAFVRNRIVIPITAALTGGSGSALAGGLGGGGGGAGGILGSLLGGAGGLLGGGFGTGLLASGSIFSGAGFLGGITGSIGAGISSIAGGAFMQGLGLLAGPIGIIGTAVAALTGLFSNNQETLLRVRSQEFNGDRRARGTATSALGNIFVRGETLGDGAAVEIAAAIADFDNIIAGFLSPEQLALVRTRLANVNDTFRDGAATVGNALDARFSAILSTFDANVQAFVGSSGELEERVQRLADAMAITSIAATGLISSDFGEVAEVLERFRASGEGLSDTAFRIVSGMSLIDDTLLMLGGAFGGTRLQAANFAGELIALSGGLDQFATRLDGALRALFSDDERNQFLADQARAALDAALTGLNISGTGLDNIREQLRTQLRAALEAGNTELTNQILTAANALGAFSTAVEALGEDAVAAANAVALGGTSLTPGGGLGSGSGTGSSGAATPVQTQIEASQAAARSLERHTGLLEQIANNTRQTVDPATMEKTARDGSDADRAAASLLGQIKTLIEAAVRTQAQNEIKATVGANKRGARA